MEFKDLIKTNNILLAPMAGITDLPFRVLCKEMGAGIVYSEMISAKGLQYNNENTKQLLQTLPEERPVGIQIFGSDPEIMADMAERITQNQKTWANNDKSLRSGMEQPTPQIDFVDINMGCPAPKIVNNGEGSALMKNPELIGKIVNAVSKKSKLPVTIKIRKGYTNATANAVLVAKIAEANGASGICVHGRTRDQFYSGSADWDTIRDVKNAVKIPVIGNGDVVCGKSAYDMIERTGVDAIMIGRASQGNPWIFREIKHYLTTGSAIERPRPDEIIKTAKKHFIMLKDYKGEYTAIREFRKNLCWYIKGLYGSAEARVKINLAVSYEEAMEIIAELLMKNK